MATRTVEASGDRAWNWPCLHLHGADQANLRVTWTTEAGAELELPSGEVSASTDPYTVQIRYIPGEAPATLAATLAGGALDSNTLVVEDADVSSLSGVYRAELRILDSDSAVQLALPFLMSIEGDLFDSDIARALTLSDLRIFLHDLEASENVLEGAQEFSDRLLYDGLCGALRQYNRATPASSYHTCSFPAVDRLTEGAAANVLDNYCTLLFRNRLKVQGQADAEQRADVYKQMAAMYRTRWLRWVSEEKRIKDVEDGWGYE